MKKILIITLCIILSLIAWRFGMTKFGESMSAKQKAAAAVPTVQLASVNEKEIFNSIEIPGRVQSMDKVDLVARIDGYLQKKHFSEGDYVKKGQILFTIEQTQYLNALTKAKADLETAKADLYKAERDYDRGAELVQKDYISKSTYDELLSTKRSAAARVKAATAQVSEAQRNYGYTQIKAPVDGKIGSLQIQEGNYVTIQSGALATITKVNPIYVKYSVDSKQFEELRKQDFIPKKGATPVKVDAILSNNEIYPIKGTQDFWDNQISTTTGTIDFRATFPNPNGILIPGDFIKVKVYSNQKQNVLVVPQELTLQDSQGRYVYIIDDKGLVQPKYFKDNGQYETYWIVKEGLKKGDKFISTNLTKLMPKMPVNIAEEKATEENK